MGWLGARFFSQVQAAAFYQSIYRVAVALLPPGNGRTWLDIGCGPGLVARLAAERGYDTVGLDLDSAMVQRARTLTNLASATGQRPPVFKQGSVFDLPAQAPAVDVVSAASLLAVLPNRRDGLLALLSAVKPGGQVLLIEPSAQMTPAHAARYLVAHTGTDKAWVLKLWARTRSASSPVSAADLAVPGWDAVAQSLLDGMVNAWILRSSTGPSSWQMGNVDTRV